MREQIFIYLAAWVVIASSGNATGAVINIEDGQCYGNYTIVSGTLNVSGGFVDGLNAAGTSTANILGGLVENLAACDAATVNVSGGQVTSLYAAPASIINLSGGLVGEITIISDLQGSLPAVHIFGTNLEYEYLTSDPFSVQVTGCWANRNAFTIHVRTNEMAAHRYLFMHQVPEPASLSMLAIGALLLKRKHKKQPHQPA